MQFNVEKYSLRLQQNGLSKPLADAQAQVLKEALSDSLEEIGRLLKVLQALTEHEKRMAGQMRLVTMASFVLATGLLLNVLIPLFK